MEITIFFVKLVVICQFGTLPKYTISIFQPKLIQKKTSEGLPFPIIASGTLVGFLWLLYGFCLHNKTIIYQNILALVLSAPQIYVCLAYPSTPVAVKKQKKN